MNSTLNYYTVIPTNLLIDKNISNNLKLFYAHISSLTNVKGYCWATNSYFSEIFGVSTRTISDWISKLAEKGYLESSIIYKNGTKEIENRVLKISSRGIEENFHRGIEENFLDNNKVFNSKNNNILSVDKPQTSSLNTFQEDIVVIIDYLNFKVNTNFKSTTQNTIKYIKARLKEKYTINDFKRVIDIKAKEWLHDSNMKKYLRPETLFGSKFESYLNQENDYFRTYNDQEGEIL